MSTRSIIVVTGLGNYGRPLTARLYKHCDGYPTGNLPIIFEALEASLALVKEEGEADTYVEMIVGKLIGAATGVYGMEADVDTDEENRKAYYHNPLQLEHLGNQGDIEWVYIIDAVARTVSIYNPEFGGLDRLDLSITTDPLKHAKSLRDAFQARERSTTVEWINRLTSLGFVVNPKPAAAPKAKKPRKPRAVSAG